MTSRQLSQIRIDAVKDALAAVTSCSTTAYDELETLLNFKSTKPTTNAQAQHPRSRAVKASTTSTRRQNSRPISSRATAGSKIKDGEPEVQQLLTPRQRLVLATETINITLKALTEAIRSPSPSGSQKMSKTNNGGRENKQECEPQSSSPQALGTPSNTNISPSSDQRRSSSSKSGNTSSGLLAVAQSARLAFAYLRTTQSENGSPANGSQLQLEQGMLALVGKLHALGLDELATKELRILKRRLYLALSGQQGKSTLASKDDSKDIPVSKSSLADLLDFQGVVIVNPFTELVIGLQLAALKLIGTSRRPSLLAAALDMIQLSQTNAPANLMLRTVSPTTFPKVARQLETLSQLLLSFCPSICRTEDANASNQKFSLSPETAFRMQSLAFEVRLQWWSISGHQGDSPKEILSPFVRCLSAYVRRSSAESSTKYSLSSTLFVQVVSSLESQAGVLDDGLSAGSTTYTPVLAIYKTLSSLSQGAALLSEAIKWTRKMIKLEEKAQLSDARKCSSAIRLSALQLSQLANGDSPHTAMEGLSSTLKKVEGSLKGDASDVDDLLLEVAGLRKAAMEVLVKQQKDPEGGKIEIPSSIQDLCEHIIYSVLGFLRRYLGSTPEPDANPKVIQRHQQRRKLVDRTAKMSVDSVFILAKTTIAEKRFDWDKLEASLRDCYSLLLQLEYPSQSDEKLSDSESKGPKQYPFVRLSNIYWALHTETRGSVPSEHNSRSIIALQKSVDVLKNRPVPEKESGLWGLKLERLAAAYQSAGNLEQSSSLLANVVESNIGSGILQQVASKAATKTLLDVWSVGGQIGNLGRAISALTKLAMEGNNEAFGLFENIDTTPEEKGVLFEWALRQIQSTLDSTPRRDIAVQILDKVARALLDIYESNKYPIRRLRVVATLLQIDSGNETLIDQKLIQEVLSESISVDEAGDTGKDEGLNRYSKHLRALLTFLSALKNDAFHENIVRKALNDWSSLVVMADDYLSLQSQIMDFGDWLAQLQSLADYCGMKGYGMIRCQILKIKTDARELQSAECSDAMVTDLCNLGLQLLHLGYSDKAGAILSKAQGYVKKGEPDVSASMHWHLAYAEYQLELGNVDRCGEMLELAGTLFKTGNMGQEIPKPSSLDERIKFNRLIADASLVCSLQCFTAGALDEAIIHAKQTLRLNHRAWACLENSAVVRPKCNTSGSSPDVDSLSEAISQVSVSTMAIKGPVRSTTHDALRGPRFWTLVPSLHRVTTHLAQLYSYHGFLNEAIYYTDQAQKVANAVEAVPFSAYSQSILAETYLRGGRLEKGQCILKESKEMSERAGKSKALIAWHFSLGVLHRCQGNYDDEAEAYQAALEIFEKITNPDFVNPLDGSQRIDNELTSRMEQLSIKKSSFTKRTIASRSSKPTTRKIIAKSTTEVKKTPFEANASNEDFSILQRIKGDVLRRKALTMLAQNRVELAGELLTEAADIPKDFQGVARYSIAKAKHLARKGLEDMLADPVFCVLPDSTISVPSVSLAKAHEKKLPEAAQTKTRGAVTQRAASKAPSTRRARSRAPANQKFAEVLSLACDAISEVQILALQRCSSSIIHELFSTLRSTMMLLYAASWGTGQPTVNPLLVAQSMEIGRNIALQRDRESLAAEKRALTEDAWKWPKFEGAVGFESPAQDCFVELSAFQQDYIDIIPSNWTALSIALNESRDELYISRLRAGESPFMIRLPLDRHNSRDAEEMVFNFDDGKAELSEIIELANFSTHSARAMTSKGDKVAWWSEREALDSRLHELLINIENIWLGGFKGIFSQQNRRPELLARFQHSFENSLKKHLPSRSKKGKATPKIALDPRILELFVGLQTSGDEEEDLDEPLTDLLYFVVDILQFNGERNAYDEIDFDSLVVETQDALRAYHRNMEAEADSNEQHTILILDKTLHAIPWESLPCLSGLSVSRLPSLGSLRQRIKEAGKQSASSSNEASSEAFGIDGSNGAFILNPSGDLGATQTAFEAPLKGLNSWSTIVQRDPTTAELESILSSRDVFLYFGHGSASQYISLRSVKKLDRCAVAFLMGCSSGVLTETGDFEPFGTPISYMQAGSPALVATLWDVTDKDIDRFASGALERWGLLPRGACQVKPHPKQPKSSNRPATIGRTQNNPHSSSSRRAMGLTSAKSKSSKTAKEEPPKKKESLVSAVAQARNDCYLRYLNGAAPVVYGVPVYLS